MPGHRLRHWPSTGPLFAGVCVWSSWSCKRWPDTCPVSTQDERAGWVEGGGELAGVLAGTQEVGAICPRGWWLIPLSVYPLHMSAPNVKLLPPWTSILSSPNCDGNWRLQSQIEPVQKRIGSTTSLSVHIYTKTWPRLIRSIIDWLESATFYLHLKSSARGPDLNSLVLFMAKCYPGYFTCSMAAAYTELNAWHVIYIN